MGSLLKLPLNQLDHYLGPLNATVTMVEYADFECPYSAIAVPVMAQLLQEFKSDLCYVYRHFPLKGIHPDAEIAAFAVEAAGKQDKFWNMLNLLFENQETLSEELVYALARNLNLDIGLFSYDLKSSETKQKIDIDIKSGLDSGVETTPTFFINGVMFKGNTNYWPLRKAIEEKLQGLDSTQSLSNE